MARDRVLLAHPVDNALCLFLLNNFNADFLNLTARILHDINHLDEACVTKANNLSWHHTEEAGLDRLAEIFRVDVDVFRQSVNLVAFFRLGWEERRFDLGCFSFFEVDDF